LITFYVIVKPPVDVVPDKTARSWSR